MSGHTKALKCRDNVVFKGHFSAYQKLAELAGFDTYGLFRAAHLDLVSAALKSGENYRQDFWSQSVAVEAKGLLKPSDFSGIIHTEFRTTL